MKKILFYCFIFFGLIFFLRKEKVGKTKFFRILPESTFKQKEVNGDNLTFISVDTTNDQKSDCEVAVPLNLTFERLSEIKFTNSKKIICFPNESLIWSKKFNCFFLSQTRFFLE